MDKTRDELIIRWHELHAQGLLPALSSKRSTKRMGLDILAAENQGDVVKTTPVVRGIAGGPMATYSQAEMEQRLELQAARHRSELLRGELARATARANDLKVHAGELHKKYESEAKAHAEASAARDAALEELSEKNLAVEAIDSLCFNVVTIGMEVIKEMKGMNTVATDAVTDASDDA